MTVERIKARIDELFLLPRGWFDGEGEIISPKICRLAAETLTQLSEAGVTGEHIYPTPGGRIQVEWNLPHKMVEAVFYEDEIICDVQHDADHEAVEYHVGYEGAADSLKRLLK